jgi:peptidoglycan/xylan/chitin deacetylase (PgdA/CDA1 family)
VFAFHDVSTPAEPQHSPQYSTHPDTFRQQLDLLQRVFRLVTLDQALAPAAPGAQPLAAITFDDGFASVRTRVQPLLAERRIPFTLFVNGRAMRDGRLAYLAQYDPPPQGPGFYLTAAEVAALARAGVQIGNHGASHRPLAGCTDGELDEEIAANKTYLEEVTGQSVRHFAIPYGKKHHYDQRSLARCFTAGHTSVYSTNPVLFDDASLAHFSSRPVPRIGLTNNGVEDLLFLVNRPLFRRIDL